MLATQRDDFAGCPQPVPSWTLSVQQRGSGQGDKLDYNQFVQSLQAELREADTLSQVSVESVQLSLPEDAQAHGLMGASNNWQRYVWKPAMLAFCSGSVMLHQSCMLAAKKASKSMSCIMWWWSSSSHLQSSTRYFPRRFPLCSGLDGSRLASKVLEFSHSLLQGFMSKGVDETDPEYPRTLEMNLAAEIKATQASLDSFDLY